MRVGWGFGGGAVSGWLGWQNITITGTRLWLFTGKCDACEYHLDPIVLKPGLRNSGKVCGITEEKTDADQGVTG